MADVFQCQNCNLRMDLKALRPVKDLLARVVAGEVMPYGQCPGCEALCHKVEEKKPASENARPAIEEAILEIAFKSNPQEQAIIFRVGIRDGYLWKCTAKGCGRYNTISQERCSICNTEQPTATLYLKFPVTFSPFKTTLNEIITDLDKLFGRALEKEGAMDDHGEVVAGTLERA